MSFVYLLCLYLKLGRPVCQVHKKTLMVGTAPAFPPIESKASFNGGVLLVAPHQVWLNYRL